MTQRSRYDFVLRSRTIHGRHYLDGKLVRRSLGTFGQWGYDTAGRPLPLPKREWARLDRALAEAWKAQGAKLGEGAATRGKGRRLEDVAREYFRQAPRTRWSFEAERLLDKDVLPALGRRGVRGLRRGEIAGAIDRIAARGAPVSARRALAALRAVLNWAARRDWLDLNPCVGMKAPGRERPRERVLSTLEIGTFWRGCARLDPRIAALLRLILLTGQRPGELRALEWAELDLDGGAWEIPAAKYKTGRGQRVLLSRPALAILSTRPREGRFVFPGRRRGRARDGAAAGSAPLDRSAIAGGMRRLGLAATPHDLRRTARSHWARLAIPDHVAERMLGHAVRGVAGTYNRYAYEREKREAAEAWGAEVLRLIAIEDDTRARA